MVTDRADFDPKEIARASFPTAFRGYDQEAVRRYLSRLASAVGRAQQFGLLGLVDPDGEESHARAEELEAESAGLRDRIEELEELVANPPVVIQEVIQEVPAPSLGVRELEEGELIELLGSETARIVEAARSAAADIVLRAEEEAAVIRDDAEIGARSSLHEADVVLANARTEADEILNAASAELRSGQAKITADTKRSRDQAKVNADKIVADAAVKAESDLASARQRSAKIVADAEKLREEVLGDLVRRRRVNREHLDRMSVARDRLAQALAGARNELDDVASDIHLAAPNPAEVDLTDDSGDRMAADGKEVSELIAQLQSGSSSRVQTSTGAVAKGATGGSSAAIAPAHAPAQVPAENGSSAAAETSPPNGSATVDAGRSDIDLSADGFGRFDRPDSGSTPPGGDSTLDDDSDDDANGEASDDDDAPNGDAVVDEPGTPGLNTAASTTPSPASDSPASGSRNGGGKGSSSDDVESQRWTRPPRNYDGGELTPLNVEELLADNGTVPLGVVGADSDSDTDSGSHAESSVAPVNGTDANDNGDAHNGATSSDGAGVTELDDQSGFPLDPVLGAEPGSLHRSESRGDLPRTTPYGGKLPAAFDARDVALTRSTPGFRRRLKRAVNDDQSDVLDRLRAGRGVIRADELPSLDNQLDGYVAALRPVLLDVVKSGGELLDSEHLPVPAVDNLSLQLARHIVDCLRLPSIDAIEASIDNDREIILDPIRAIYRDFRNTVLPDLIEDALHEAFALGLFYAVASDAQVLWMPDPRLDPDPICEENSAAPPLPKGTNFPSGHVRPLSMPGCRCLAIPSS